VEPQIKDAGKKCCMLGASRLSIVTKIEEWVRNALSTPTCARVGNAG
jgi:hypothetical protein